jgi:urease accessory protein
VIVFGILVALPVRPTPALTATAVGLFAVCHGYVHGVEMPAESSGLSFGLGLVAAAALLHLLGIGVGTALKAANEQRGWLVRAGGASFAVAGLAMLTGRVLH